MTQIPVIRFPDPVVLPATEERIFDAIWISELIVRTLPPTDSEGGGVLKIGYQPMNSSTLDTLPEVISITTDKLMLAVSQVPEVAAAMVAILNAVQPLKVWVESQQVDA